MADRYNALTVVLEEDIREDDAEPLMHAIKMLKGVQHVSGNVAGLSDHTARIRARQELAEKLIAVLYPPEENQW